MSPLLQESQRFEAKSFNVPQLFNTSFKADSFSFLKLRKCTFCSWVFMMSITHVPKPASAGGTMSQEEKLSQEESITQQLSYDSKIQEEPSEE